jgi:hypothetical protein
VVDVPSGKPCRGNLHGRRLPDAHEFPGAGAGQKFKDVQEFFDLAKANQLQCPKDQWLPPSLLKAALASAERRKTWSIAGPGFHPKLLLTAPDGTVFTTVYALDANKDFQVKVDIQHPPQ